MTESVYKYLDKTGTAHLIDSLNTKLSEKADSDSIGWTMEDVVLSASKWKTKMEFPFSNPIFFGADNYLIYSPLVTVTSLQFMLPAIDITAAQMDAFRKAILIGGAQDNGVLEIIAKGTVPTVDIPIRIVYTKAKQAEQEKRPSVWIL